jgi:hypothetical protein
MNVAGDTIGLLWFCLLCELRIASNQEERISNVEKESASDRLEIGILATQMSVCDVGNCRSCCHVVCDSTATIMSYL